MDIITTIPDLLRSNGSAHPVMVSLTQSEGRLIASAPAQRKLLERIRGLLSDDRRSRPLGLGPDARTGWIDEIDGVIGPDTGE